MRINSLLFAAVLFVCSIISSTTSASTTARSLTSKQEDVAAHGVGMETTKEERGPIISDIEQLIKEVDAMPITDVETTLYSTLRARGKDEEEAYTFLQLDQTDINSLREQREQALSKYANNRGIISTKLEAEKREKLERKVDKRLIKLIIKLENDKSKANLHDHLKSTLILSWMRRRRSSRKTFEQLGLHVKPTSGHSVNLDLLKLWVEYVQKEYPLPLLGMLLTIKSFDNDVRARILGSLRQIKNIEEVAKRTEDLVLSSWVEHRVSVKHVVDTLNLEHVKDQANFNMLVEYVVKGHDTLKPKEKEELKKLSADYGDNGRLTMFFGLADHKSENTFNLH